jgi:hypothetical protein
LGWSRDKSSSALGNFRFQIADFRFDLNLQSATSKLTQINQVAMKNDPQSCRDKASEIFFPSENCTIALSLPEFMKNDPQSCRDKASEIFCINENLMIAVSRRCKPEEKRSAIL